MKSPIKAHLVTHDHQGRELAKRVKLFCHLASGEATPVFEVWLDESEFHHTAIYIDYKSLMKEVKKHEGQ